MSRDAGLRLSALVFIGLMARAALLPSHGVWLDEALSLHDAQQLGHGTFLAAMTQEAGCPLYLVLLRAWTALFGDGTVAAAALSVLFSALVPWLVFCTADRTLGRSAAWWAALLAVLNTQSIEYAVEIRWYALLELWTAVSWYCLVRSWDDRRFGWGYALVGALGLYTHLYFVTVLAGQAVLVAVSSPGRLRQVVPCWVVSGVLFLPWVWILKQQPNPLRGMLAPVPDVPSALRFFCLSMADKLAPQQAWLVPVVGGLLVVALVLRGVRHRVLSAEARLAWLYGMAYVVAVGIPILVSMWTPLYVMRRYDTAALLPLELALGWVLSRCYRPLQALAVVALLLASAQYGMHLASGLDTDRQVVAALRSTVQPSDVVIYTGLSRLAPDYYFAQDGIRYGASYMFPGDLETHPSWIMASTYPEDDLETELQGLVQKVMAQPFQHVIVFYNSPDTHVPGRELSYAFVLLRALLLQQLTLQDTRPVPEHVKGPFYDQVLIFAHKQPYRTK